MGMVFLFCLLEPAAGSYIVLSIACTSWAAAVSTNSLGSLPDIPWNIKGLSFRNLSTKL